MENIGGEVKKNIETGQLFVASAAANGISVPVTFVNARTGTAYRLNVCITTAETGSTTLIAHYISSKSTTGFVFQARKSTGGTPNGTLGDFYVDWEVWDA